jgi:GNAT superfamily N-acetyltransferase
MNVTIRDCRLPDDLHDLTELLHRAYAELAARGLKYFASYQTPDVTEERVRSGRCFVAEAQGRLVGTITVRPTKPNASVPLYREKDIMIIGQFGVAPDQRGKGIGRLLHSYAVRYALECRASRLALDTAAPATDLIEMYSYWGYQVVTKHKWKVTNYESVVMQLNLKSPNHALEPRTAEGVKEQRKVSGLNIDKMQNFPTEVEGSPLKVEF